MNHRRLLRASVLAFLVASGAACSVKVQIQHEPAVARSTDTITFTAEVETSGPVTNLQIQVYVNGALVKTCGSSPCVYVGGPYPAFENEWLGYHTEVEATMTLMGDDSIYVDTDLGYTGITTTSYTWKDSLGVKFIPVRWGDWSWMNTNVLLMRDDDYAATYAGNGLSEFLGDVGDKLIGVLMKKDEIWGNMEDINIYAYRKEGDANSGSCGTVHADTSTDASWSTDHGILHIASFGDCTSGFQRFTAEGSTNTQAFLHEFSHSIFEQADEYDGNTFYFEASDEPNIFDTEAACRNEQVNKGRDPDECYRFTTKQTGWWGIHSGTTVMTNGLVTHPWSTESVERQRWWFDNN
jgi:hypothetical protein